MRFLTTRVHGMMDYLTGALLIAIPFALGYPRGWPTWVTVAIGAGVLVQSLTTNYEMGLVPLISMPAHLAIDFLVGAVLVGLPWYFNSTTPIWVAHLTIGLLEIAAALT